MKMNRLELLGLLKILSPATASSKNQLPELACIWFDGSHASAFNDVLGIRIAFATEFSGGILGDKLLGVLERSRAKDVDLTVDKEDATLKIGNARIKLTRRPIEDWFWTPEVPDTAGLAASKPLRDAIGALLLSVGAAAVQNPEQRGITVVANGKAIDLYSTDAVSMSWVCLETGPQQALSSGSRVILPTPFCEQLRSLKPDAELKFDDSAVYCLAKIELDSKPRDVLIFSKLVGDDDPVSFEDVLKEHTSEIEGVDIPQQLKLRAERAMVLLDNRPLEVEVEDGQLYLYAQTPYGEIDDVIKLAGHPNVKVKLDAALLHRALDSCSKFSIAANGVVMTGDNGFVHVMSTK